MLLPISLAMAICAQVAAAELGPEVAMGRPEVLLKIAAGESAVEVVYRWHVRWEAGEQTVVWRPGPDEPKPDAVRLTIEPAEGVEVAATAVSADEARWAVKVARGDEYVVGVEADASGLKWSLAASGAAAGTRVSWRAAVRIENSGDRPTAADGLVIVAADGSVSETKRALVVPAKGRVDVPVGPPRTWEGLVVHRFTAADGKMRRVLKVAEATVADALGPWGLTELAIEPAGPGEALRVKLSAERGAEVDLGPSRTVAVRRTLIDERREALDFDRYGRVQGYDTVEEYFVEVVNVGEQAADVEIWEEMTSAWEMKAEPPPDLSYADVAVLRLKVLGGQRATVRYRIIKHSGTRAR